MNDMFTWVFSRDGAPEAYQLMRRHYSFHEYKDGRRHNLKYRNRRLFIGPGEKVVLLTPTCDALFVWRKFIDKSGQQGVNCAVFRNESKRKASELILEAEKIAWKIWPGERLYTYVNPLKINTLWNTIKHGARGAGWCFKKAGWNKCGVTKSGLIILEKLPQAESIA